MIPIPVVFELRPTPHPDPWETQEQWVCNGPEEFDVPKNDPAVIDLVRQRDWVTGPAVNSSRLEASERGLLVRRFEGDDEFFHGGDHV